MIAIIGRSRTIDDPDTVREGTLWADDLRIVCHGDASGVDQYAAGWAEAGNLVVQNYPIDAYVDDHEDPDNRARERQNQAILEAAVGQSNLDPCVIVIADNLSPGLRDLVDRARAKGVPVSRYEPAKAERQSTLFG